ncbi:ABC transporter ATP-binding protein [Sinisalibacter aestuarii]|uniref:ABC transporter ATP-binding protein n=1 Tax=Sinisalibacter aestuarii TaxID=2949426 RepID=A0ABQ5M0K1_9RHOB|nr:ABC transporter ATP-binding protein [Sinisalibacter aestuarii]GKY90097.1 ABC transporter ATP-binding protein [Sinisalibacter aestuarii]
MTQKDSIAVTGEAITLTGVSKTYMTASGALPVLRDIDLHIEAGQFVSFVGPSGCGKSTLLNIIAGLVSYDTGTVTVGGQPPREGRDDIGFMLQKSVLMPWLNVSKNIELPFIIARRRGADTAQRVTDLLELVGLSDYATMNSWELSGGMQQRVALARALALDPGVMLMDEPFSALDEFKREHLNIEVAHMSERFGKTTILVTHSISEAVLMSDRIIALGANPGRMVGDITVDLERPRRPEMIGSDRFQQISNEVRAALSQGMEESQ